MSSPGELAARLEEIVAELDELALAGLHDALADGRTSRPPSDRELTRARRAVEKAAHVLRSLERADAEPLD